MFKLVKGNVFQKLNSMDRKQAYTYGGIGVAILVALLLLASFLGNADDQSFDGYKSRGYDLANSPFATDEAEEFLLASMYPDMQNNGASALYTPAEKLARQEADEEEDDEEEEDYDEEENDTESPSYDDDPSDGDDDSGYSDYSGRGSGGGRGRTEINNLESSSMGYAGGTGLSGESWGGPRVDTDPYKNFYEESEKIQTEKLKRDDARRSLAQFAQGSRAAAGLKDNRALNMKRAMLGGNIAGANAFKEDGTVDLSKVSAAQLDTNAPKGGSPDLSSLKHAVSKAADQAKRDNKPKKENPWLAALRDFVVSVGKEVATGYLNQFLGNIQQNARENSMVGKHGNAMMQGAASKETLAEWGTMSGQKIEWNDSYNGATLGQVLAYNNADATTRGDFSTWSGNNTGYTKLKETGKQDAVRAWNHDTGTYGSNVPDDNRIKINVPDIPTGSNGGAETTTTPKDGDTRYNKETKKYEHYDSESGKWTE